jgi:hypothetical protein
MYLWTDLLGTVINKQFFLCFFFSLFSCLLTFILCQFGFLQLVQFAFESCLTLINPTMAAHILIGAKLIY